MMTGRITDNIRILPGLVPADITTVRTGAFVDISGAQRVVAAAITGAVGNGKTVTIGFLQAQSATGAGAKALGTPVVVTSTADGSTLLAQAGAQVSSLDVNNGFAFVAATLVSNNASAVQASAVMLLGPNRFNP